MKKKSGKWDFICHLNGMYFDLYGTITHEEVSPVWTTTKKVFFFSDKETQQEHIIIKGVYFNQLQ